MSKGIQSFQAATQGFNSSEDSIGQYVQNYDSDFFTNWRDKANSEMGRLSEAAGVASGIGGAVVAAKQLRKGVQKLRSKFLNKDEDGGDEDGKGDGDQEDPLGEDSTGPDMPAETGVEPDPMAADTVPFPEVEPPPPEAPPQAPQPEVQDDDFAGDPDETPLQAPKSLGTEVSGEAGDVGGEAAGGLGEAAGAAGEAAAGVGADVGAAAATAASGVGEAALGALSVGLDALGPVGLLAGVGVGLYELFHHPKPPPPPPVPTSASTKGEMIVPTFDSVTDTPASMSAF